MKACLSTTLALVVCALLPQLASAQQTIAVTHVTVIDVTGARPKSDQTVLSVPTGSAQLAGSITNSNLGSTNAPPLRVCVDPRVELMSLLFRLAGNDEHNQGRVASTADVTKQFNPFRDHPAVQQSRWAAGARQETAGGSRRVERSDFVAPS